MKGTLPLVAVIINPLLYGASHSYRATKCLEINLRGNSKFWSHIQTLYAHDSDGVNKSWVGVSKCAWTQWQVCSADKNDQVSRGHREELRAAGVYMETSGI